MEWNREFHQSKSIYHCIPTIEGILCVVKHMLQQECIPVGCVPSATVAVCWGGACSWGVLAPGGCLLRGGVLWGAACSRGYLLLGGVVSQHALRQTPSCRQTDRCKNTNLCNFVADGKYKTEKEIKCERFPPTVSITASCSCWLWEWQAAIPNGCFTAVCLTYYQSSYQVKFPDNCKFLRW